MSMYYLETIAEQDSSPQPLVVIVDETQITGDNSSEDTEELEFERGVSVLLSDVLEGKMSEIFALRDQGDTCDMDASDLYELLSLLMCEGARFVYDLLLENKIPKIIDNHLYLHETPEQILESAFGVTDIDEDIVRGIPINDLINLCACAFHDGVRQVILNAENN